VGESDDGSEPAKALVTPRGMNLSLAEGEAVRASTDKDKDESMICQKKCGSITYRKSQVNVEHCAPTAVPYRLRPY
jgi:hypothetical protein